VGKGIPEASRKILKNWRKQGLIFYFDGNVWGIADPSLAFDNIAKDYSIQRQLIPEGLTVKQVEAMGGQGLMLDFNCGSVGDPEWHRVGHGFNWAGGWGGTDLLARLRIPAQPIPEKLLAVQEHVFERGESVVFPPYTAVGETLAANPTPKKAKESDPHGTDPHSPGAKLDAGKNRLGLVLGGFARALEQVGLVGTGGAVTYSDNGWKKVPDGIARYEDAMLRHWNAIKKGVDVDPKTGMLHQAHLAWNALAVLELMLREENKNG